MGTKSKGKERQRMKALREVDPSIYDSSNRPEEGNMVIVEGPDGAGKSSLVRRLCGALGCSVMDRACTSDGGPIYDLKDWVDRDLARPVSFGGLYDRHPLISEPIYGPLIRGHMADGFDDIEWLTTRLNMLYLKKPLLVFCLPPWLEVQKNIIENHEGSTPHLEGVIRHARPIYELYILRAAQECQRSDVWVWDYTGKSAEDDFLNLALMVEGKI